MRLGVLHRRVWFVCLWFSLAGDGYAQAPTWEPPPPGPGAEDWIKFTSGEWLKGEVKRLRNETLQFESDQLKSLTLDWNDVAELRSSNLYTYVFVGQRSVLGTAAMKDGVLLVAAAQGAQSFQREQLMSIVPGGSREIDYWTALVHAGLVLRSGNTDQGDLNTVMKVQRETPLTRLALDYYGNFGRISGTETVDNHNGQVKLDAFLSNRLYLTPVSIDILVDRFQNIEFRVTPAFGVGVRAVDKPRLQLDTELAGGYQWAWFYTVQPGEPDRTDQVALIPSLRLDSDITSNLEFKLDYSVTIGVPDVEHSFQHARGIATWDLSDIWSFDASFTWDRVETPRPDEEGNVPERDDFRFSFGIGIEY